MITESITGLALRYAALHEDIDKIEKMNYELQKRREALQKQFNDVSKDLLQLADNGEILFPLDDRRMILVDKCGAKSKIRIMKIG